MQLPNARFRFSSALAVLLAAVPATLLAADEAASVVGGAAAGSFQFSNSSTFVSESAGSRAVTINRTGGSSGAVSVQYNTAGGSATSGVDFSPMGGTLNWANGVTTGMTVLIPIANDGAIEGDETLTVQLTNATGGATLGSPSLIVVTITDDDAPAGVGTVHFTNATGSVSEGSGNQVLTVERVGGSTGAITVAYATSNGTASTGPDYDGDSGVLSWADGQSGTRSIVIPIVSDAVDESNETFSVTLSNPTGGVTLGTPSTQVVTITDDDGPTEPCASNSTTLCLEGGSGDPNRFQVRVTWTDFDGNTGAAKAVPFTDDSGLFYFFNSQNIELLVKMVNGCGTQFNAYWFFYAAASNVHLVYEVVDTATGVSKTYTNNLGVFASGGDINALATCP